MSVLFLKSVALDSIIHLNQKNSLPTKEGYFLFNNHYGLSEYRPHNGRQQATALR